jgi:hypothetical protein
MKIRYKEDPRAWRKSTLLSALGLLVLSSLLRWRHALTAGAWGVVLIVLAGLAFMVWVRPQSFRGYYRFSTWAGFWSSQWVARLVLILFFLMVIVPAALILRLLGKDSLHLKRLSTGATYWRPAKQGGSLDRLF